MHSVTLFLSFSLHPSLSLSLPFRTPPSLYLSLSLSLHLYLDSTPGPSSRITYSTSPGTLDGLEREL